MSRENLELENALYIDDEEMQNPGNVNTTHAAKLVAGAILLAFATAAATYFITKKTMEPSASNSVNPPCVSNATGVLGVYMGSITYPANSTNWIEEPMTEIAKLACKQLLCNATALANVLSMINTFVFAFCQYAPQSLFQNATPAQCNGYFDRVMATMIKAGCAIGIKDRLFGLSYGKNTTNQPGNITVSDMRVRIG